MSIEHLSSQEAAMSSHARSLHPASERILNMFEAIRANSIPRVHLDRARLFTESMRRTEGQPLVLRWARALHHIAEHIPVTILADELIVGRPHSYFGRYGLVYPELDGSLLEQAVEAFGKRGIGVIKVLPEDREIILGELAPYWSGKDFLPAYVHALPEDTRRLMYGDDPENTTRMTMVLPQSGTARHSQNWFHDYGKVIERGFASIRAEAQDKLERLSNPADREARAPFYEAVVIACDAVILFAHRYSRLAAELAAKEENPRRRAELESIAEVCARVPEFPARSFQEAVQAQWFTQLFSRLEQNVGGQVGNGRMDQYLYPLYAKDIAEGSLTREKAIELLQCVWLNMWQSCEIKMSPSNAAGCEGFAHFEAVTIGGQTAEGRDATNELSYVILESSRALQCTYPEIGVRVHAGSPEKFLFAVAEAIKDGKGTPKLLNDEAVIPFYLANGAKYAEALDYGISGCVETRLPNRETHVTGNGAINYGIILEMTLRNGRVKIYGDRRFGPETGDPRSFGSYEDFWNAFRTQLLFIAGHVMVQQYVALRLKPKFFAAPMDSALHTLAMKEGMDLHRHGEYIPGGIDLSCLETIGLGTAIDSLAAVKKLVYDEKSVTMDELLRALDNNFEGYEAVRQRCLNAPKYGNDDPYADDIGFAVNRTLLEFLEANPKPHGQSFMLRCIPITYHVPAGKVVAATPNGRKAGVFLSEGISASHGADVLGPTAALNSYAAARAFGYKERSAELINMKFSPANVAGPEGTRRLVSFIRSWCAHKIWHIQFNIINRETLLAAQDDPEGHRNLVVRVAGYSAYFVDLSPAQQSEIIARTEEAI